MTITEALAFVLDAAQQQAALNRSGRGTQEVAALQTEACEIVEKLLVPGREENQMPRAGT